MQTKRDSLIEAVINIAIGFFVGIASQVIIFKAFGMDVNVRQNFILAGYFTVVSLVRSYYVRRIFNKFTDR